MIVGIPVKPFAAAKSRLAAILTPAIRRSVSIAMAHRTVSAVSETGAEPVILAADREVSGWADSIGTAVVLDLGSNLDTAAAGLLSLAAGRPWAVCHADLPLLQPSDLVPAFEAIERGREAIAPSSDGGTSLLGMRSGRFEFAYGPASFHRHLVRLRAPLIVTTIGLMLDLDGPDDVDAAAAHPRGRWLFDLLPSGPE